MSNGMARRPSSSVPPAQASRKSEHWRATRSKRWWGTKCFWNSSSKYKKIGARTPNFSTPLTGAPCGEENKLGRTSALRMRLISLTVLFSLLLIPLLAEKEKDKTPISDDTIVDQVRVKIADDSEIGGQPIQVDSHDGKVVLTGKVSNDKLKVKAEKVAKKVKGVMAVDNKLVISPN